MSPARQPESADDAGDQDAQEPAVQPEEPGRKTAGGLLREASQSAGSSKPSALDQLLTQAVELGIRVDDNRMHAGSIWVEILEPGDNTRRRLIRKLIDFGFAFCPGKGYWK